jgi:nitronate monooxygenase
VLIPLAAQALRIPVIASGGIADGRGMAAALALGAEGINMGTRFVCTQEAPVHPALKAALCNASERDTRLIFRTLGNTARVFKNAVSEHVLALEQRPGGVQFEELRPLVAGARGRRAWESGDVDGGVLTTGMVVGLIRDIPTCRELIERIIGECRAQLEQALSWAQT